MQIHYDSKIDLLYLRFSPETQPVTNVQATDSIVLDIGEGDKLVGIEILGASQHVNLERLIPIEFLKTS